MWEGLCRLCSNVVLFYIKYLSIHRFWFPVGEVWGRKSGANLSCTLWGYKALCTGPRWLLGRSTARHAVNTDMAFPFH